MEYHEIPLDYYFFHISHEKYIGQHNQYDIHKEHDGMFGSPVNWLAVFFSDVV